jgi:hypothetical protein
LIVSFWKLQHWYFFIDLSPDKLCQKRIPQRLYSNCKLLCQMAMRYSIENISGGKFIQLRFSFKKYITQIYMNLYMQFYQVLTLRFLDGEIENVFMKILEYEASRLTHKFHSAHEVNFYKYLMQTFIMHFVFLILQKNISNNNFFVFHIYVFTCLYKI